MEVVRGDINGALGRFMDDVDGVVHLVGIIEEVPAQKVTFEALFIRGQRKMSTMLPG